MKDLHGGIGVQEKEGHWMLGGVTEVRGRCGAGGGAGGGGTLQLQSDGVSGR